MKPRSKNLITLNNPTSHVSEAYKMFRTNLHYINVDNKTQVILFTSATAGEGKTTTACNTAITFAQDGKKVLLVECDLRRARVHKLMGLPQMPGLTNIIADKIPLSNVVWNIEELTNLDVLTCGPFPPSPAELLGSHVLQDLIEKARTEYDKIIIDSPPILHVTDANILLRLVDGVILVVGANKTKKESFKRAVKSLDKLNANILGVVLNGVKLEMGSYYYDTYKNYYTEKPKKKKKNIEL